MARRRALVCGGARQTLAVLPSRNRVLLPGANLRLKIGRAPSVRLVEELIAPHFGRNGKNSAPLVAVAALDGDRVPDERDPVPEDLHPIVCIGRVTRCDRATDDGEARFVIVVEGEAPPGGTRLNARCSHGH